MKQSISKNMLRVSLKTVVAFVVPLITFPYVSRILQVEAFGRCNFSSTAAGYFALLAELGIGIYAVKEGSRIRNDAEKINRFASEMFAVHTLSTLFSAALLFAAVYALPKLADYRTLILIFGIELILNLFSREYIFSIYEDFAYLSRTQMLMQIISVPLTFLLVRSPDDVFRYAAIRLLALKGPCILYGIRAGKYMRLVKVSLKEAFEKHIRPILFIFGSSVGSTVYLSSDTTILGWISGDLTVGLYSVASKIYEMYKLAFTAIYPVLVPRLSESFGTDEFAPLFTKLVNMLFFAALPATTGLFMLSDNVIMIIAGEMYSPSVVTLRILCAASLFAFSCALLGFCVMMPAKMEKRFMLGTWCSAVFNIAANIIFIPAFRQNAAAATTVASELLLALVCYFSTRGIIDVRPCLRIMGKDAIGCVGVILCCALIKCFSFALWTETVICVVLSAGVYALTEWAVRNPIFYEYAAKIKDFCRIKTERTDGGA